MDKSLKFMIIMIIMLLSLILIVDFKRASLTKMEIKNALNISSKAATLQIDLDPNKISEGIFEIDTEQADISFEKYMIENLSNDIFLSVIEHKSINATKANPVKYINPITKEEFLIDKPSYVAVVRYNYEGLFVDKIITLNNISTGELIDKYKLK